MLSLPLPPTRQSLQYLAARLSEQWPDLQVVVDGGSYSARMPIRQDQVYIKSGDLAVRLVIDQGKIGVTKRVGNQMVDFICQLPLIVRYGRPT